MRGERGSGREGWDKEGERGERETAGEREGEGWGKEGKKKGVRGRGVGEGGSVHP